MAFAALELSEGLAGYFVESYYGRPFEYKNAPADSEYPHLVFVGPAGTETRWANVKKTVAYVVVDEEVDSDGNTV